MVPDEALAAEARRHAAEARAALRATGAWLAARPPVLAAALSLLAFGYAAAWLFTALPAGTWPWLGDSVIFEYIGWFLAEGNRLYIDVWEVKPPLSFEVTALLALLAGEQVVLYHVLNLLANAAAIAVGAAAAAGIVHDLTGDRLAAVVAGVAPFALPVYSFRALVGFKPKYLVVATGLGCLWLAYRERPVAAGAVSAAAVGTWQFAAVFPCCVVGLCWQRGGRRAALRAIAAGLGAGALVLLPVLYWGALPAMVAETVFAPLLLTRGQPLLARVWDVGLALGPWVPVALVGVAGLVRRATTGRLAREWLLLVLGGWFAVQLAALDYDNPPDLFPWVAVLSLGVGLAVAALRDGPPGLAARLPADGDTLARALAAAVLVLAAVAVATMGGFVTGQPRTDPKTYDTTRERAVNVSDPNDLDGVERQYVYWNRRTIANCRAFGGYNQYQLVRRLELAEGQRWETAPCGQFGPTWRVVRAGYGFGGGNATGAVGRDTQR
jgi:hypothetical protein